MKSQKSLDDIEHQRNPLSVKEAAELYGESVSNFYKMIRQGEVPGVFRKKPKSRIKICPREFIPWIKSQFAVFDGANHGAARVQSNGQASFTQNHQQDRSLPEVNYGSDKNRREDNVA